MVKNLPANAGDAGGPGLIPGWEDPLEEETATHSSTLVWKTPQTGESGGVPSMGSQRVRHDWTRMPSIHPQTINNVIVTGGQQSDSAIHMLVSTLPQTPLPSRLPYNIEQSSLFYTVWPYWLSILNTAVCARPSQTPLLSVPCIVSSWSL